jgi:hypothetical protein
LFGGWKVWLFGDFGHFVASFEPISKHFFFWRASENSEKYENDEQSITFA